MEQMHILNLRIVANKCTACKACELACSFTKEDAFAPSLSRIRVVQLHEAGMNVPITCSNCVDAPCIEACPTGAALRDASVPVVRINEEDCTGCGACVRACPFGAVDMNEERGVAIMCDLCGGKPVCVDHCIYGALSLGQDLTIAQKKRLAEAYRVVHQYQTDGG